MCIQVTIGLSLFDAIHQDKLNTAETMRVSTHTRERERQSQMRITISTCPSVCCRWVQAYRYVRDMKVIASLVKEERQEELLHFFYDLTYKEKATMEVREHCTHLCRYVCASLSLFLSVCVQNSLSLLHGEFSLLYKEANDERRNLLRQTTEWGSHTDT